MHCQRADLERSRIIQEQIMELKRKELAEEAKRRNMDMRSDKEQAKAKREETLRRQELEKQERRLREQEDKRKTEEMLR